MSGETISQAAQLAGVGVETIRFYERKGLLKRPASNKGTFRLYGSKEIETIRFIRSAKELGFTLKEIKELLTIKVNPNTNCKNVKIRAEEKLDDINVKLKSLRQIKRALTKLITNCSGDGPVSQCTILQAIGQKTK